MGQKVQPTGFRLGVTESWRSRWYADKDYAEQLGNDLAIRKYLEKRLEKAAVARIDIERAGDKVKVTIFSARPGIVIGKKGAEIDGLRADLERVAKVLRSAVANAENNNGLRANNLVVKTAFVDEGPTLKRIRPRAKGSASRINKRMSHITVVVAPRKEA